MGQTVRAWWIVCRQRWTAAMPRFFKVMMRIFACIGGATIAINTAFTSMGIIPHDWWTEIQPYLIGISVGGCFVCKFTEKKGDVSIPHITDYDKEQHLEN